KLPPRATAGPLAPCETVSLRPVRIGDVADHDRHSVPRARDPETLCLSTWKDNVSPTDVLAGFGGSSGGGWRLLACYRTRDPARRVHSERTNGGRLLDVPCPGEFFPSEQQGRRRNPVLLCFPISRVRGSRRA